MNDFDRKWLATGAAPGEQLLGTADLQSLADLSNSVGIISHMRLVPLSRRLLLTMAAAALVPLLPVLLFEYPIADLTRKLVTLFLSL